MTSRGNMGSLEPFIKDFKIIFSRQNIKEIIPELPIDLKLTIILAGLLSLCWSLLYAYFTPIYDSLIPYIGSIYPGYFSLFFLPLVIIPNMLTTRKKVAKYKILSKPYILVVRVSIILLLALKVNLGITCWSLHSSELINPETLPLDVSPYQPIFTILFPAVWLLSIAIITCASHDTKGIKDYFAAVKANNLEMTNINS